MSNDAVSGDGRALDEAAARIVWVDDTDVTQDELGPPLTPAEREAVARDTRIRHLQAEARETLNAAKKEGRA